MDDSKFKGTMENYASTTTKLLLKLNYMLTSGKVETRIPEDRKQKFKAKIMELYNSFKELESLFEHNENAFTKEQILNIGKAHGRIESLMILIGLNVK